jgi:hypothetical protein
MLQKDKNKRPTISHVFESLKNTDVLKEIIKEPSIDVSKPSTAKIPKLKISLNLQSAISKEEKKDVPPVDKPSGLKIKGLNID